MEDKNNNENIINDGDTPTRFIYKIGYGRNQN